MHRFSAGMTGVLACALWGMMSSTSSAAAAEPSWNPEWTRSAKIVLQETKGLDRVHEPVNAELLVIHPTKSADSASVVREIRREFRVVRYDQDRKTFAEIPSQVYDIRPVPTGSKTVTQVTVRLRAAFFADVPAHGSGVYYAFWANPNAPEPKYPSPLAVTGSGVKYAIENDAWRILTEEKSGQIDEIDLKFSSKASLRFKFGTLHWNPDFIVIPENFPLKGYTWWYAHHFIDPPRETESGPIFFSIHRSQLIPGQDTAWMEVDYRFYAGLPYFLMSSRIEAKKDCRTFAIRNDELAFGRTDFTHAAWRDKTPDMLEEDMGEIGAAKIWGEDAIRGGGHPLGSALPANMAWISLFNTINGDGVASIRIAFDNTNVITGEPSPLYNSHTVVSEHDEGFYWFRSLIYSPRGFSTMTNEQIDRLLISVPKGSSYAEKNAYLLYRFTPDTKFGPVDDVYLRLKYPLRVMVVSSPTP